VHHVQVDWQCDDAAGVIRYPLVDQHVASSNVTTTLQVGQRWVLFAGGRGVRPGNSVLGRGHAGVGLVAGLRADALVAFCLARAECRFVLGTKPYIRRFYSKLRALMLCRVALTRSP